MQDIPFKCDMQLIGSFRRSARYNASWFFIIIIDPMKSCIAYCTFLHITLVLHSHSFLHIFRIPHSYPKSSGLTCRLKPHRYAFFTYPICSILVHLYLCHCGVVSKNIDIVLWSASKICVKSTVIGWPLSAYQWQPINGPG